MTTGFPPLPPPDWPSNIADMRSGFASGLNIYRVMAHHPQLLRAWAPLRDHVVNATALGPQLSEIAILRTGHRLGSSYEWSQHIVRARARGLSDVRICSVAGAVADMAPRDAMVARSVDELFDANELSAASAEALERDLGKEAVLDLVTTVGFYCVLGWVLNSFDVPLDDDISEALQAHRFDPDRT